MESSHLPLLVQSLYAARAGVVKHHVGVRRHSTGLNTELLFSLESVYQRDLTDLKAPPARSNSSIEQFCKEVNRICLNSWLSLTAEKPSHVLKVKWSIFFS